MLRNISGRKLASHLRPSATPSCRPSTKNLRSIAPYRSRASKRLVSEAKNPPMPPTLRSTTNQPPDERLLTSLSSSVNSTSPEALIYNVVPLLLCVELHDLVLSPDDQNP